MSSRSTQRRPVMRERVREAASTAILEATEQVAAERGLEATSTAAIAERAGVAVGTLYNYFPDREALIAALFKYRREELVPRMIAAAEAAKALPFEDRLRTFVVSIAREFDRVRLFCRVAMSTEGQIKIRKSSAVMPIVTTALTEILKPVLRDRAAEHAVMIFGALKAMMQARLERDEPLEPAAQMLVDTVLGGLQRK